MTRGLAVKVVDVDPEYLGIEIRSSNGRFSGSTYIYAHADQLREFAGKLTGFPLSSSDRRTYEFGTRDPKSAGGFCGLRFYCVDSAGHARLDIEILDRDPTRDQEKSEARFSLSIAGADIDQFTTKLLEIQEAQTGEAGLPEAV